MRWLPATTFGRLLLLLASLLLALLFLIALAFRAFGVGPNGATYADLIAGNVALARAGGTVNAEISTRLDLRRAEQVPVDARAALLPFQRHIGDRLRRLYGPRTQVLFSGKPDSRVWVRLDDGSASWIGVRVPPYGSCRGRKEVSRSQSQSASRKVC